MFRSRLVLVFSAVLLVVAGCADIVGPVDDFELPVPDLSLDPDRLRVGALIATYGGRVTYRYVSIPWLGVILPDRMVRVLRDRYEVEYVESSGVACLM